MSEECAGDARTKELQIDSQNMHKNKQTNNRSSQQQSLFHMRLLLVPPWSPGFGRMFRCVSGGLFGALLEGCVGVSANFAQKGGLVGSGYRQVAARVDGWWACRWACLLYLLFPVGSAGLIGGLVGVAVVLVIVVIVAAVVIYRLRSGRLACLLFLWTRCVLTECVKVFSHWVPDARSIFGTDVTNSIIGLNPKF